MTISATNQLMEPVLLDTKAIRRVQRGLTAGAAAASEYISKVNDDLALEKAPISTNPWLKQ